MICHFIHSLEAMDITCHSINLLVALNGYLSLVIEVASGKEYRLTIPYTCRKALIHYCQRTAKGLGLEVKDLSLIIAIHSR